MVRLTCVRVLRGGPHLVLIGRGAALSTCMFQPLPLLLLRCCCISCCLLLLRLLLLLLLLQEQLLLLDG